MPLPERTAPLSDVETTTMSSTLLSALSDMEISFIHLQKKLSIVKEAAENLQKRDWETASDPATERPYDFNRNAGEPPRWEPSSAVSGSYNASKNKPEANEAISSPSAGSPCEFNRGIGEARNECSSASSDNASSNEMVNKLEAKETAALKTGVSKLSTTDELVSPTDELVSPADDWVSPISEDEEDEAMKAVFSQGLDGPSLSKQRSFNTTASTSPFNMHLENIQRRDNGFLSSVLVPNYFTWLVETLHFKFTTAAIVIANCALIGLEVDADIKLALKSSTKLQSDLFDWASSTFAVLFTIELMLRVCAYRIHYFCGEEWKWNTFDTVLVLSAWLELSLAALHGVSAFRVLRSLRLARALRILRVISIFRNLQLIVQGLMESFLSLFWTLLILFLCLYLIAIILCEAVSSYLNGTPNGELIAPHGDALSGQELHAAFERHYRTLPRTMLSVFFSVTGGLDWYDVMQPIMHISFVYVGVYALFITFVVFGIFNALNACFVESVLSNRDKDLLIQAEHHKIKVFLKDMNDLFKESDTDGNRTLTKDELEDYCLNPRFCAYLSTHSLDATDAKTLFDLLDVDGDGVIDIEEFTLGTLRLKGHARLVDVLKLQMLISRLQKQIEGESPCPSSLG